MSDNGIDTLRDEIHKACSRLQASRGLIQIMEVCGTHTMSIARSGLRSLFPANLKLTSGPGCPVCVTDQSYIDQAVLLAADHSRTVATFGDMVRVPGAKGSLAEARAAGADVQVVISAHQAVELARRTPDRHVTFLAVGFETTAPGTALALLEARKDGVKNFSVLVAHKLVVPAMLALLAADDVRIDGFICPGHVSVILGYNVYEPIATKHGRPCVVTGFDPHQILLGLAEILRELESGKPKSCSIYPAVTAEGNKTAQKMLDQVFVPGDVPWRAIGVIPQSGLVLRPEFYEYDAEKRFSLPPQPSYEMPGCRCGDVISGRLNPHECKMFGRRCTPRDPLGPCMVSSEGACAAAYKYERHSK